MSRYGVTIYGTDYYGERSTLQYSTTLELREHNYTTIRVSLTKPPGGNYNRLRIVRSLSGPPVSAYDEGTIVWDSGEQLSGPAVDSEINMAFAMPGYLALDQNLRPGRWAYYSVFVYAVENTDTNEGEWFRLDTQPILVPTYYNGTQTVWDMLPTILKNSLTGAVDEQYTQNDDLASFIGVFGFRLDILRSLVASTADIRDANRVAYQLVQPAIEDLGTPFEEALGPDQMRRFLNNQSYFYKKKGTLPGVRGVAIAVTGYATEATVSGNLIWAENFSNANYDTTPGYQLTNVGTWNCRDGSGWQVLAAEYGGFYLSPVNNSPSSHALATMGPVTDPAVATAPTADCLQSAIPVHAGLFYTCGMTIPNRFGGADAAILWLDSSGTLINQVTATDSSGTDSVVTAQAPEQLYDSNGNVTQPAAVYAIPAIQWTDVQVNDPAIWQNVFFTETPDPTNPPTYSVPNQIQLNLVPARVNLVTNPSFTVDTNGWTEYGAATLTRTAQSVTQEPISDVNPASDVWFGEVTLGSEGVGGIYIPLRTRAGARYAVQLERFQPVFDGASYTIAVSDVPASMGEAASVYDSDTVDNLTDTYVFSPADPFFFFAKGNTTYLYIEATGPANTTFGVDQVIVEETNLSTADLLPYFDADVFNVYDEYDWSGTPNASESYYYPQRSVRIPRLQEILPRYLYFGQSFTINFGLSRILGYISDTVLVSRVVAPEATSTVGRAIDLEWKVSLEGSNAISLEWNLIGPGGKSITLDWNDRTLVDSSINLRSDDDKSVGKNVSLDWEYYVVPVGESISPEWSDNQLVSQDISPEWNDTVPSASPLPINSTQGNAKTLYNAGQTLGLDITVAFNGNDSYKAIVFGSNGVAASGNGDGATEAQIIFTNGFTYLAIYQNGSYPVNGEELTGDGGGTGDGTFRITIDESGFITAYVNGTPWGTHQLSSSELALIQGNTYVGYGTYDQNVTSIAVVAYAPKVSDAFTRADNANSLGNADTGQTWQTSAYNGGPSTWGITGDTAYTPTSASQGDYAFIDSGESDTTIRLTITAGSNTGILFRYTDTHNHFICDFNQLGKHVPSAPGGYSAVGTFSTAFVPGDVQTVVLSGSTITVQKNGITVLTATDAFNQTATMHGMTAFEDTTARLDNFSVV